MNEVLNALKFRHACKKFDPAKKIPEQTLREILECARLSPSSFGMEPWKFLVIRNTEVRQKLRSACWDQPQITDSSDVVVILEKTDKTLPGSEYVKKQFHRRNLSAEAEAAYIDKYASHYASEIEPVMNHYAWDSKQCYIALSNIMTGAASAGVDSCPIEGFQKQPVEKALEIDTNQFQVVVLVALGYRAGEQTPRHRLGFDEVVEFIN
ncbi:MAG: NAD(P)H-dependent oxidoreductase [Gammaproteobacteria bacterium]|jgi:nitroreductase